jgi:hypothetical protein
VFKPRKSKRAKLLTKEQLEDCAAQGMTLKQAAKALGCSHGRVGLRVMEECGMTWVQLRDYMRR